MMKTCVLAAMLSACLGMAGQSTAQFRPPILDPVVASYAQDHGVSTSEAKRRLSQLEVISDLERRLIAEIPDQFGGLRVVHQPTFRVEVFLTHTPAAVLSRFTRDPMFEAVQTPRSLELLRSAQIELSERLHAAGVQHESGIEVEKAELDFYVLDTQKSAAIAVAELAAVPYANLRQVSGFIQTTATIQGGRQVSGSTQNCTSGFNVVHATSGLRGVTTAGHCDNTLSYSGTTLAFQGELNQGSDDFQWNRHASSTYPNQIYIGSGLHTITASLASSGLPLGWTVCKYGISGGYRCGEIADKNAQSNYNGQIGTYIRVRNASNLPLSIAGDSGGPVFGTNTAYGLIHGRGASGTAFVNDMYFMPIERFSGLNLSVATTP